MKKNNPLDRIAREKIFPHGQALLKKMKEWSSLGEETVFTNGCFDLLHLGHLSYLKEAASLGDRLIIGLNADASVRTLKGANRPIWAERERSLHLACLTFVDAVVVFEESTPEQLIELLLPDILVKGGDYKLEDVVGKDIVESAGGRVQILSFLEGYSSTALIEKIQSL
jgi:rfaE bifunctional protein nucleotidyltransferase chain/domain